MLRREERLESQQVYDDYDHEETFYCQGCSRPLPIPGICGHCETRHEDERFDF